MIKYFFLILSIAISSLNLVTAQQHRFLPTNWNVIDDNKCDGSIEIELVRYRNGHTWGEEKKLYLQFKNQSNNWEDILSVRHYWAPNNKYVSKQEGKYSYTVENRNPKAGYDYYAYRFTIQNAPRPNTSAQYRWVQKSNNDYLSDTKRISSYKPVAVSLSIENNIDCTSLKLKWNKPYNTDGDISYLVYRKKSTDNNWPTKAIYIVKNKLEYTDTQVNNQQTYDYIVNARNSCNNEGFKSNIASGHAILAIEKPNNIKAEAICNNKINISWDTPKTTPSRYELFYKRANINVGQHKINEEQYERIIIEDGDINEYQFQAINSTDEYTFYLRNENKCGTLSKLSDKFTSHASNLPQAPLDLDSEYLKQENAYRFTWTTVDSKTEYILKRVNLEDAKDVTTFEIDANTNFYQDKTANFCTSYKYTLYSNNECGLTRGESVSITIKPDLSKYFDNFEVSKGYFSDRVELNWQVLSNRKISEVKIYRSLKGDSSKQLLATLESRQKSWTDEKTEPNVLYEYSIEGIQYCGTDNADTNTLTATGFRMPYAKVYGQLSFEGGNPVANVEVIAEPSYSTKSIGKSILFDGNSYLEIKNSPSLKAIDNTTFMMWVKPDNISVDKYRYLIHKLSETNKSGFALSYNKNKSKLRIEIGKGTKIEKFTCPVNILDSKFTNIAISINDKTLSVYIDGKNILEENISAINISNEENIFIGGKAGERGFTGLIDELSIFAKSKTAEQVKRDYNRKLSANDKNLIVYLQMDEGVGSFAYDSSKTGHQFNKHHAKFESCIWSNTSPSSSQLSYKGISDENGNYTIDFIKYQGRGDIFNITPIKGIHKFRPAQKRQFLGKANEYASIDFADISSFRFTGSVKYTLDNSNYPAKGIRLLIDGNIVSKLGKIVETDENGEFDIQVPIGNHVVSVEKSNHKFLSSTYPETGTHDFRANISGVEFKDTSYVKLAGRVVGGKIQGDKIIGFGQSVNNIGVATIHFKSQSDSRYKKQVKTDSQTGEYEIKLLPINIVVSDLTVNNADIIFKPELYSDILKLDQELIDKEELKIEYTNKQKTDIKSSETYKYNLKKNFIYRSSPSIGVFDQQGNEFAGEKNINITVNKQTQETQTVSLKNNKLGFPILFANNIYNLKIKAFEEYKNKTLKTVDRVPVTDGIISVINNLGDAEDIENIGDTEKIELNNKKGEIAYKFESEKPNLLINDVDPNLSYTSSLKISLEAGGNISEWKPNGDYFRAYLIGTKTKGNNFVTTGPQSVKWILHDPPGSNSYSYIESGSVLTKSTTVSFHEDIVNETSTLIKTGPKIVIGGGILGPQIETEVISDLSVNINVEQAAGRNDVDVTEISFSKNISTSADANLVGTPSDLFIGYANNIIYGEAESFGLLPIEQIKIQNLESVGLPIRIAGVDYKLAKSPSYFVNTNGFNTMFIYTFDHIENNIIPDLVELRNNLFTKDASPYKSKLKISDERYAYNNDDKIWGNLASSGDNTKTVEKDFDGQSYKYDNKSKPGQIDSVRWYNQQIRLWNESLKRCEREKIETVKYFEDKSSNISFVGGGQSIESSKTVSTTSEVEEYWDISLDSGFAANFGVKLNNVGVATSNTLSVKLGGGGTYNTSNTTQNTYSYVLSDGDLGDAFTVDILDPETNSGPVFRLRAGKSSCPFEGIQKSNYYRKGTIYNHGTQQREVAKLEVASSSIVDNIPSHQEAVFTLNMANDSQTDDSSWYALRIVEGTNPNGASVKLNGGILSRPVEIKAGSKLQVQLSLSKNVKFDEYEDIKVMMYSTCEFENYQNGGELLVADTINLSAYFIASCGRIEISKPKSNWLINKNSKNAQEIILSGLQSIDENFSNLILQYKEQKTNSWINLQKYVSDKALLDKESILIQAGSNNIKYLWNTSEVKEGEYELRILSTCNSDIKNTSIPVQGTIDRISPSVFGSISPKDGTLNTGELIQINFSEDISTQLLSKQNIKINGILNNSVIDNSVVTYFDGVDNNILIRTNGQEFNKSFSIEFWAKRNKQARQTIFSQSSTSNKSFEIGFDANNRLFVNAANEVLTSESTAKENAWLHWTVSYNHTNKLLTIYKNDIDVARKIMAKEIVRIGDIRIGKSSEGAKNAFCGGMHHLRVWNKNLSRSEIVKNISSRLSGAEINLYGLWRMNEGIGNICLDLVRSNNAIFKANWEFNPKGKSALFNGHEYIKVNANKFAFADEDNYSISFWFYTNNKSQQSIFSLGSGDNDNELNIYLNQEGNIIVNSKGIKTIVDNKNLADANWHHFSMSVNKPGATNFLIDGQSVKSISSKQIGALAGESYYLACKANLSDTGASKLSDYFKGQIDEFRIWSYSRNAQTVKRSMHYRQDSNQKGLESYLAFEDYSVEMNVSKLTSSLSDLSSNKALTSNYGAIFSNNTPAIKLNKQAESVNFSILKSERSLVIHIDEDSKRIEKTNIDISIFDILDKHNNKMVNPINFSLKIDQNQLRWTNTEIKKEFHENTGGELISQIVNTGVKAQNFRISNIPNWINVIPQAGTIEGGQSIKIKMQVHQGLNVGHYNQALYLSGDKEFSEPQIVDIYVQASKPEWQKELSNYQYNMNIIGRLIIDDIPSTDSKDMIAAYVGSELRGFAKVNYQQRYDNYSVFLSIGSNNLRNEKVHFKIWDASTGLIYPVDNIKYTFVNDDIKGSIQTPIVFESGDIVQRNISIKEGWNWISVNLRNSSDDFNTVFNKAESSEGDRIVGQKSFFTYSSGQWEGSQAKISFTSMYKLFSSKAGNLQISGIPIDPVSTKINIDNGWNWISYTPQYNAEINEALSLYQAHNNAEIKTMDKFARYDSETKRWYGSLTHLKPGEGYQINSEKSSYLTFPLSSSFSKVKSTKINTAKKPEEVSVLLVDSKINMTLVACLVDELGNSINSENISAYNANKALSITKCTSTSASKYNLFFITIPYQDNINEISFKYKSHNNKIGNIKTKINFEENNYMGSIKQPKQLIAEIVNTENQIKTYPNPVNNLLNIEVKLDKESDLNIEVYSIVGEKLTSINKKAIPEGKHVITLTNEIENLKAGTYILKVNINTEHIETKFIKI